MTVIDLSHTITESIPVYPGTECPSFINACTIDRDGFAEKKMTFYTHTGTHLDAPAHILPGAGTVDKLPIGHFYGRAVLVDCTGIRDRDIGPEDLEPYRQAVEASRFVILHTGWSKLWGNETYFDGFPVLSDEAARWLCGFNLKGLGIDAMSVDRVGSAGFPVHRLLLDRGLVIIENLTNLDQLTGRQFTFCCFPLKIAGADGSPVRAAALAGP